MWGGRNSFKKSLTKRERKDLVADWSMGKQERGIKDEHQSPNLGDHISSPGLPILVVEDPPANSGDRRDAGSIPGLGRSPGGWYGNPLQLTEESGGLQSMGSQRVGHD